MSICIHTVLYEYWMSTYIYSFSLTLICFVTVFPFSCSLLMFTCQWHSQRIALPVLCVSSSPPNPPGSSRLSLYDNGSPWRYPRTKANSNKPVHKLQLQAGFTAFSPECSAVFGRIYSCGCSTKYTSLLSCRPKRGPCKPSRVSLVLSLVGHVDTAGCICTQMSSNHICSKILLQQWQDRFKGRVLNQNLSVLSWCGGIHHHINAYDM